ncbi:MAG: Kelch repeat protein [Sphingobacteriales bacterium]|nr:Kelch repeat protein [Sphingobacteriales bacterium]
MLLICVPKLLLLAAMKFMIHKTVIYCICLFFSFYVLPAHSQNYGIRFLGQDMVVQDNRTSMDLCPNGPLCFSDNFDLSFKVMFIPKSKASFGYIVRIIDNQSRNIDLMMYDQEGERSKKFKIVIGERFSSISFGLDSNMLYNRWNTFRFHFDIARNKLVFYANDRVFTEGNPNLKNAACFKILVGANSYQKFKTTDLPAMQMKDIGIAEKGKATHLWTLDEFSGNIATDRIQNLKAKIVNPRWIRSMHYTWEQVNTFVAEGNASIAFNPKTESLYITSTDKLHSYSLSDNSMQQISYKNGKHTLLLGNQCVYDPVSGDLINLNIDKQKVAVFDFSTQTWDAAFSANERITKYWHVNKFISAADHSLYVLGGYGELSYKNDVQKYSFADKSWKMISVDSTVMEPRYLAALGSDPYSGNAYVIGGYGSLTGVQMLNPRNFYDLIKFDVKRGSFKKIYSLKYPENDFAFANSLVIDEKAGEFYGLIFPNQKFNSSLQLIRGSLTKPMYQVVGNKIPYSFQDIRSFADLYYCAASKKLVAVTLFKKSDSQTQVTVYTIDFPPNGLQPASVLGKVSSFYYLWYVIAGILLPVLLYLIGFKFRTNRTAEVKLSVPAPLLDDEVVDEEKITGQIMEEIQPKPAPQKRTVQLFGNMQVFDAAGNDISRLFTPRLKEMFLLILIYSVRRKIGVSSERLDEILWFDKSKNEALNNRSVNIARLKTILDKIGSFHLSKVTGYWKIEADFNQVYIDYQQYLEIMNTNEVLDKPTITKLFVVIQRGCFLLNTDYEWLDEFKTEITNEIIDRLLLYARSVDIASDPEFLIQTTSHIFQFDGVNEDAMHIQCKALTILGKHSVSKHVYEKFVKEYKSIYNEDYNQSFHSIIK